MTNILVLVLCIAVGGLPSYLCFSRFSLPLSLSLLCSLHILLCSVSLSLSLDLSLRSLLSLSLSVSLCPLVLLRISLSLSRSLTVAILFSSCLLSSYLFSSCLLFSRCFLSCSSQLCWTVEFHRSLGSWLGDKQKLNLSHEYEQLLLKKLVHVNDKEYASFYKSLSTDVEDHLSVRLFRVESQFEFRTTSSCMCTMRFTWSFFHYHFHVVHINGGQNKVLSRSTTGS